MKHIKYFFTGLLIAICGVFIVGVIGGLIAGLFYLIHYKFFLLVIICGSAYSLYSMYCMGKQWYDDDKPSREYTIKETHP